MILAKVVGTVVTTIGHRDFEKSAVAGGAALGASW